LVIGVRIVALQAPICTRVMPDNRKSRHVGCGYAVRVKMKTSKRSVGKLMWWVLLAAFGLAIFCDEIEAVGVVGAVMISPSGLGLAFAGLVWSGSGSFSSRTCP
jgi:hypothetical protein